MRRRLFHGAFGALLLGAWAGCGAEGDRPGFVVMPEMYDRIAYGAFDPNEVTENGQTLLLPPEGTVPYGASPFLYGPGDGEADRAGRERFQPLEPTPANLARGRQVYQAACYVCHGAGGRGDGPIIGRFPNPPSLLADRAREMGDGQIVHVIVHGQGLMAPHGAHVQGDDRWRLVMYLRQLQGLDPAGAEAPPTPPAAEDEARDADEVPESGDGLEETPEAVDGDAAHAHDEVSDGEVDEAHEDAPDEADEAVDTSEEEETNP